MNQTTTVPVVQDTKWNTDSTTFQKPIHQNPGEKYSIRVLIIPSTCQLDRTFYDGKYFKKDFNSFFRTSIESYIDVDDGCWRRNVLMTVIRCW